ncbi:hypothetical protein ASG73_07470 [Janibacter sp. Soil728]|uniref:hypothetical protein n=1 Tax=Janibacter sp. Soil728 TaxID=1736393 RepID=UPI0006F8A96F|nr:hypothetical protein [Janibacter sp. Soil728]KRE37504.1 hypothetical protein ASG73_07470 [Janibacter sp. Soil728]
MLGRHPIRRPARAAALAAVAALTLSACGGSDGAPAEGSSAVAAAVAGEDITVGDVQRTTRELRTFLEAQAASTGQQPQQLDAGSVVTLLVQAPAVLDFAEQEKLKIPSAGSVRQSVAEVLPAPSEETVNFLRANALSSQLDPKTRDKLIAHLEEQQVTISPRYAAATGQTPDWLEQPVEQQAPVEAP